MISKLGITDVAAIAFLAAILAIMICLKCSFPEISTAVLGAGSTYVLARVSFKNNFKRMGSTNCRRLITLHHTTHAIKKNAAELDLNSDSIVNSIDTIIRIQQLSINDSLEDWCEIFPDLQKKIILEPDLTKSGGQIDSEQKDRKGC